MSDLILFPLAVLPNDFELLEGESDLRMPKRESNNRHDCEARRRTPAKAQSQTLRNFPASLAVKRFQIVGGSLIGMNRINH